MSSPSKLFSCHWRASPRLLLLYLSAGVLAALSVGLAQLPGWLKLLLWLGCIGHAYWVLPRAILLSDPCAFSGICCEHDRWFLYSAAQGWQAIELHKTSIALPWVILLRVKVAGMRFSQGVCIPFDALAHDTHRRLRVRLKFSRQRWLALK